MFGRLRLADFLPADDVTRIESWEYLDRSWCGEANGFTEWLCLESDPHTLRSAAVDLVALSAPAGVAMLAALRLPLRPGMTAREVTAVLGPPKATRTYVSDRTTYEFRTGSPDAYEVSCTVRHDDGLTYVTVHPVPLPR
ncbi:hypothetical protein ACFPIJ_25785 [Dactylosporangium cerinum]|uniref:Uncharacterized protein n=1 Tax=Dactylosporangium cerinum TaxID=1434730 RepID=A0ABV9W0K3_9ACTN